MKNKTQFDHNLQKAQRQHKAERKETQRKEYSETKYGYRTQNNYPHSW